MKITIKKLVEFRRKSDPSKITFVRNLLTDKEKSEDSSGGDYWITSLSSINNSFKSGNSALLDNKIDALREKIEISEIKRIKDQFQQNIEIITKYKDFDIENLKPNAELKFLKRPKSQEILRIKNFQIEAKPSHIFSFSEGDIEEIGGVWFIAKKGGLKKNELGMFTEMLYRYLSKNYSENFHINPNYCIAVDLFIGHRVDFAEIENGSVPRLIDGTVEEIRKIQKK
ncbi:hypothetical protein GVN16_25615 [Emticicia sp. CRIBPO]|uniref:hypothetical protein n=1 Tax=Emticicia sp. CRIBPO TaxID=2683258 RepID=UPI001412E296|nr:hypothetical protein [Emticicia sp. CRIBPO]NBA89182.1 hypothetical protein [Emticicia sp. CRIBPO]